MRRRVILAALVFATTPLFAQQNPVQRVPVVAVLSGSTPAQAAHMFRAFLEGLREQGFVDGENVKIVYHWAEGRLERLPEMARELVARKPDVIFAPPTSSALAARDATHNIPIVFALAVDPVDHGLVGSLARPGGNATGMSTVNAELGAKRLELLKEAFPRTRRVAAVYNPADASNRRQLALAQKAAANLGMTLIPLGVQGPGEHESALAAATRERADALLVMENPGTFTHRQQLVGLINRTRLPAMYSLKEFVDAGGLMAYTVNYPNQFRRAGHYVARILKGAKPAELPVEQPSEVDLVVNLATARKLGLSLPAPVLLRASEVVR